MAIDLARLKTELIEDPLGLGYTSGGLRRDDVADQSKLNSKETGRTREAKSISSNDLQAAATIADLKVLPQRDFDIFRMVTTPATINLSDTDIRGVLAMFDDKQTAINIAELFNEKTSRARELFGEDVGYENVLQARNLP